MILSRRSKFMALLLPAIILLGSSTARGYEVEMKALAARIVSQLQASEQKNTTVLDFTDLQSQGTELGRFLAQEFSDQLVAASKTIVFIDRANLEQLLQERKFSIDGLIKPETSRKLGNMIGIDTIIRGTVTPIDDQIRLSVRAVALETGKIVASSSATLPVTKEIAALYTRGVATTSADGRTEPQTKPSDIRTRIRADSFKLVVSDVAVDATQLLTTKVNFVVENRSGIGLGMALREGETVAGPCTGEYKVSGMATLDERALKQLNNTPNPGRSLRWVPAGGKTTGTVELNHCSALLALSRVPVTATFVVATDKEILVLPLNSEAPVRRYDPFGNFR